MNARELLKDPRVQPSVAWRALKAGWGDGAQYWEPEALRIELTRGGVTPTDGLMAKLLGAQTVALTGAVPVAAVELEPGASLTDDELLMYLITLMVVGSETTPMVIAAFFYYLDHHPAQKQAVLADHGLIRQAGWRSAITGIGVSPLRP